MPDPWIDAVTVTRELFFLADGQDFMSVSVTFTSQCCLIYDVLCVGNVKIGVFCNVTPCCLNGMLPIYQTKRRHIAE